MDGGGATRPSATVYVGNLPRNLVRPEEQLYQHFHEIGPVISIKVCRDQITQQSLGYAYINFKNPESAETAVRTYNYFDIEGHEIRVSFSNRDPTARRHGIGNIFVRNIDVAVTARELHEFAEKFGPVQGAEISRDKDNKHLGYGFVQFQNKEDATAAVTGMDGKELKGTTIDVQHFRPRHEREKESETTFTKIFIKNLTSSTTEEELKAVLTKIAPIESIFVGAPKQYSTKFSLVTMAEHEGAVKVIEELSETVSPLAEGKMYVARHRSRGQRPIQKSQFQSEGRNVYVKHLPQDISDEKLREAFGQFGEIESIHLQMSPDNLFRGFAFICFATKESADKSVASMHGRTVYDNRPLYVKLAQSRDARARMLQEQRARQQNRTFMNMTMGMPQQMMPMHPMGNPMMTNNMMMRRPMLPRGQPTGPNRPPRNVGGGPRGAPPPPPHTDMAREENKQQYGEALYGKIVQIVPDKASKITGMLLEMDAQEIQNVLQNDANLSIKIEEAISVLAQHS